MRLRKEHEKQWTQGLVMAIVALLIAACHPTRSTQSSVPATQPATTANATITPSPYKAKTKAEAIAMGLQFLQRCRWELDFVYLYSYLQPQFVWPELPAQADNARIADSLRRAGTEPAKRILDQMTLFQKLRDPGFVLDQHQLALGQEEDAITVPALYCDAYRLDTAIFFPKLRAEAAAGDYRLTHALLACIWLQGNGCCNAYALRELKAKLIDECQTLIQKYPSWMDLNIEAAALMQAAGERLPEAWIEEVIAAQQADGGWLDIPQHTQSNTHTTILALWMLAGAK